MHCLEVLRTFTAETIYDDALRGFSGGFCIAALSFTDIYVSVSSFWKFQFSFDMIWAFYATSGMRLFSLPR